MPPVTDPNGPPALLNPLLVALLRSNMFAHTRANGHERIQIVIVHAAQRCSSEKHLKSSLSLQCLTNQGLPFLADEVSRHPVKRGIYIGGGSVTPRVHSGLTYPVTRARDPLPGRVVP